MAEDTTKTKVESDEVSAEDTNDLLSLESLDEAIASSDPEFAESISTIGPDEFVNIDISLDALDEEYSIEVEKKIWQDSKGLKQKIYRFFPFLPFVSYHLFVKRMALRLALVKWKARILEFLRNLGPLVKATVSEIVHTLKDHVGNLFTIIRGLSLIRKIFFALLVLITGASTFFFYVLGTKGLVSKKDELFIGSLSDWAGSKFQYDPKVPRESFYESTRTSQNVLLLKKMIVNLRRSPESGENPMGAFEFLVEGGAADVVVEIKDRESEVEDLFLRTLEEMTFEQVSSAEGKKQICERLRKEVNQILTKGFVRRVFIKNAIVKP